MHLDLLQAFISLGKLNARNARPIGSEALQELLCAAREGFDLHSSSVFGGLTVWFFRQIIMQQRQQCGTATEPEVNLLAGGLRELELGI